MFHRDKNTGKCLIAARGPSKSALLRVQGAAVEFEGDMSEED